jgi:predicted alpha/beta-fold hydrolase
MYPIAKGCPLPFSPPAHLRAPLVQTLRPFLRRRAWARSSAPHTLRFFRAPDGEPLVAETTWQPGPRDAAPAAVLVHGLEGSSTIHYMVGLADKLFRAGFHVVRLNQRGCGAGEGLTRTVNHGGRSEDVAAVLDQVRDEEGARRLVVVGFSLGGNLVLKLLGECGSAVPAGLVAAAALSPLVNPALVQRHLDQPASLAFRLFFLHLLARRMRRRARRFPDHFDQGEAYFRWTVRQFDDEVTAPHCGFASAADYYRRADALPLVGAIRTPTLVVHAHDDPLVPFAVYDGVPIHQNPAVQTLFTPHGGHLGFYDPRPGSDGLWAEDRTEEFLRTSLGPTPHTLENEHV